MTQAVARKMQQGRAPYYMDIIARLKVGLDIHMFVDLDVPNEKEQQ